MVAPPYCLAHTIEVSAASVSIINEHTSFDHQGVQEFASHFENLTWKFKGLIPKKKTN